MKCERYVLLAFAALLPLAALAAGVGPVFGQSCGIQVGSVSASTQYSGSYYYGQNSGWNILLNMPISLNCPYYGSQLWAVGNVYDTAANANVGSGNVVLYPNGGYYSGQIGFTLPSSVVQHLLQVSISVYSGYSNGQYGALVASTSPTVTIHAGNYYGQTNPYNGYYNDYSNYCYYQNGYMYCYYPYSYYYNYYYYSGQPYYVGNCFNGQAIVYYNGAYYYVNCYSYYHHR